MKKTLIITILALGCDAAPAAEASDRQELFTSFEVAPPAKPYDCREAYYCQRHCWRIHYGDQVADGDPDLLSSAPLNNCWDACEPTDEQSAFRLWLYRSALEDSCELWDVTNDVDPEVSDCLERGWRPKLGTSWPGEHLDTCLRYVPG